MPSAKLLSRRDLDFLLFEWLDVPSLTSRPQFAEHTAETFVAVLDLAEELASRYFAPHNARADVEEPHFDGERVHIIPEVSIALKAFCDSGLLAATAPPEYGGAALPRVVQRAGFAYLQAANISTASYLLLTAANADLLLAHGSPEQIATYVPSLLTGRFFGTMCLSEPEVGSSLGDLRTKAVPAENGTYRLFGEKMWISGGDHDLSENIVHLVLGRLEGAPPGPKGLSLFLVPKILVDAAGTLGERNDVSLVGVNHKMGFRGTVNTVLSFGGGGYTPGGAAGAIAHLVGEPNRGLDVMFHMMNDARIGIGIGATALGYAGYLEALEYARTRLQGRPIDAKDATTPPVPIIKHPDVRRMLMASKAYAEGAMALSLYCARLSDEEATGETEQTRDAARLLLDVLTPIAKSWPSQWCLAANDLAIQIHGGYGYSREYPVEQLYRDNRLNPIHEGTHGVQALDLLGRKVVLHGGAGLHALLGAMRQTIGRTGERTKDLAAQLSALVDRLEATTARLWAGNEASVALANATLYLEAAGHIVVAWLWLDVALATANRPNDFYAGKRAAARFFFQYELPRVTLQLDLLDSRDTSLLELKESWF